MAKLVAINKVSDVRYLANGAIFTSLQWPPFSMAGWRNRPVHSRLNDDAETDIDRGRNGATDHNDCGALYVAWVPITHGHTHDKHRRARSSNDE
jgi:hypothetical protein